MTTLQAFNEQIAFMCNSAGVSQTETMQLLHHLNQSHIDSTKSFNRDKRWKESQSLVPLSKIEKLNEQEIVLYGVDECIYKFNIMTKNCSKFKIKSIMNPNKPNCEHSLNVNGTWHVIGGEINTQHLIWDETKKDLQHNYTLVEYEVLSGGSLIYVPTKELIFVIGGKTYAEHDAEFFNFNIWMHDLRRNKWKELDFTLPYHKMKTALTSDENYIIISGGYNPHNQRSEKMYILDIRNENNYKLRKLTITNPIPNTSYDIVTMENVNYKIMLVSGWIRKSFQNLQIARDLLQIICNSFSTEKINLHWMQISPNSHKHFTIEFDELLADIDNKEEEECC